MKSRKYRLHRETVVMPLYPFPILQTRGRIEGTLAGGKTDPQPVDTADVSTEGGEDAGITS